MTSKKDKNIIERTNAISLPDGKKPVESTAVSTPIEQALNEIQYQPLPGLFHTDELSIIFFSKLITALAMARTRGIVDNVSHTINVFDIIMHQIAIGKPDKDGNPTFISPGVGEAKLLRYGVSALTQVNAQYQKKPTLRIYGDTKAFARDNKIRIDPQQKETPEEQKKENQRAAKALENFVAKLGRNALMLKQGLQFDLVSTSKGQKNTYIGLSILAAYKIDEDIIELEFTQIAAEHFIRQPLSRTPRALYAIDDRQTTAYAIAEALTQHYDIEKNVMKNTERIIKVETLLSYTSLPTMDECRLKRLGWEHFVKEPFEKALDTLYQGELIAEEVYDQITNKRISGGWRYSLSGMEELTDEQAATILRYEQFASLYICYELSDYEPHADRVKHIEDKRATRNQKRRKKAPAEAKIETAI